MTQSHIVALSGGKDSTALAVRLKEVEPRPYVYVCTPTLNELPEMKAHWDLCEQILEAPLIRLSHPGGLEGLIEFFNALPNNRQRWCTRILKIKPYQKWIRDRAPATSYVGLRADEDRLGVVYDDQSGITQDYPMKRWGWKIADVLAYLRQKKITIPKRTDCAFCYDQRIGEWYELWKNYPILWLDGEKWEEKTGHTFRSATRDSWPAAMKDIRRMFEAGAMPKDAQKKLQGKLFQQCGDESEYERCRVCRM